MKTIEQKGYLEPIDGYEVLRKLERIGRTAYKSEDKITHDSCYKFVKGIIVRGHESVLEHVNVTAYLTIDRAIAQELTRHRIGAYTHESTRYVNYQGKDMEFIHPEADDATKVVLEALEADYKRQVANGVRPEIARDVLPLSLASSLVVTYNLRQWRHVFKQRFLGETGRPHPKMVELMRGLLAQMVGMIPVVFDDLGGKA